MILLPVVLTALIASCRSSPPDEQTAPGIPPQDSLSGDEWPYAVIYSGFQPPVELFTLVVPGTTARLTMVPVRRASLAGWPKGQSTHVETFWISTTEITWDMYDAFVFAFDRAETETDPPDAWARPSKPYILMDRGFGHAGYPAISVSYEAATEFCKWLSARTGESFALPTEAEWMRSWSESGTWKKNLDARAWHAGNSEEEMRLCTHPVGTKEADGCGLFDLIGNVAEWTIAADGKGVARGGSFRDPAESVMTITRSSDDRALNASDPQIPKSRWWLADGGFIGFRVVAHPR